MTAPPCLAQVTFDLSTATLRLDEESAVASLLWPDGSSWPLADRCSFLLEMDQGELSPAAIECEGRRLTVRYNDGGLAEFSVATQPGFAVFRLERLQTSAAVQRLRLFRLAVPRGAEMAGTINAACHDNVAVAVMAAKANVHAFTESSGVSRGDRAGCSHEFERVDEAKAGKHAARFTATCNEQPAGWSVRGKRFPQPLDLTGCTAIRAWVHGDGKGQQLKIQLFDGAGGYRDNYLPVDFTGWRQVTLTNSPINSVRYERVSHLNFYYNGLPAGQTVTCLLDQVEAVIQHDGKEKTVVLEDFESLDSPLWSSPTSSLNVETLAKYGLQPAAFAVLAAPRDKLWDTMQRFEQAAGVPSPRPGGVWSKQSPWVDRSYFFLTRFRESQFDEALAIAQRGGFSMILIDQSSWTRGTGHYEINRDHFPDGLKGLARTVQRFHEAGFRVGLHFLGASIYPPDPYITPVPDPRLVKGAAIPLAADVDAAADFLPTAAAPQDFPAEDGGYRGEGTVLQIGDELVWYGQRSMTEPFGFAGCRRGHLGTKASAHAAGGPIRHLVRAYGYHMYDMDTSLIDEVAEHFARVANTCGIDMIYFDGSERLQGDHWYYNACLHQAFYDRLKNKNMLLQASSHSHWSWHLMSRSASADGHGDLKGYLDERSPWFDNLARNGMPLDIGWYYGYDTSTPLDMYEYVLGATIGYDSSMSFQVSVDAAAKHPFTGAILDLIARYERLRLSGRVPQAMKERLRIDPKLGGQKTPEQREQLASLRREYRLLDDNRQDVFQRVIYAPWQDIDRSGESGSELPADVPQGGSRIGFQIYMSTGAWLNPGPAYRSPDALLLESFDDLAPYTPAPDDRQVHRIGAGQAGSVSPGVSQQLQTSDADPREGPRCGVYSASSTQPGPGGWSAIGRSFDPPLDLSWHRGIGFWLRGDGGGGSFKLQLRDGKGAADYYIANDYTGWRYQQLPRPDKDPIDYTTVRTLMFYYNGLPGQTSVTCGMDDIKALRTLDVAALEDPGVEINGQGLKWQGTLRAGQYLIVWPGEPAIVYGPTAAEQTIGPAAETITLDPGQYAAKFSATQMTGPPPRVRITLQPSERYVVP